MTLVGDDEMLWHVFSNLVNNAIKFRRREGQPHIAVRAAVEGERVTVRVEDDGIGVSAEEQEKVFTRFYQGTASTEGSGVGLSICKRITEDLGGRIRMESPGKGQGMHVRRRVPARLTGAGDRAVTQHVSGGAVSDTS